MTTDFIVRLYRKVRRENPLAITTVKANLFAYVMNSGRIDICKRLRLSYRSYLTTGIRITGSCSNRLKCLQWLHEEEGVALSYREQLEDCRYVHPELLVYMRERYDSGENIKPLRVWPRQTPLRKAVTRTLIDLVDEYNIPIHDDDIEYYEKRRRKLKGDWDARRQLILFRRTRWV